MCPILTKCGKYSGNFLPAEKFSGNQNTEIHHYLHVWCKAPPAPYQPASLSTLFPNFPTFIFPYFHILIFLCILLYFIVYTVYYNVFIMPYYMYLHTTPQCWYDCYTRVTTQIIPTFIPQLTHKTYKSEKNAKLQTN